MQSVGVDRQIRHSATAGPRRRVAVVQGSIPHYRVAFFEALMKCPDLEIDLFTGPVDERSARRLATIRPGRLARLGTREWATRWGTVHWQGGLVPALIRGRYDCVICEQANRYPAVLASHLLARTVLGAPWRFRPKWLWWGHGADLQLMAGGPTADRLKAAAKTLYSRMCDGALAYTSLSRDLFVSQGIPIDRVWSVDNTIDVDLNAAIRAGLGSDERAHTRAKLGLRPDDRVVVFNGRIYKAKHLEMLIEALAIVGPEFPDVRLLVIGDGQERAACEALAGRLPMRAPVFAGEVVDPVEVGRLMALGEFLANPGLVGLAIVHGFCFGLPLLTTDWHGHSPEIAYLEPGKNGVMTRFDVGSYAAGLRELLRDRERLGRMRQNALDTASRLTLDHMVGQFRTAVLTVCQARRSTALRRG